MKIKGMNINSKSILARNKNARVNFYYMKILFIDFK